MPVFSVLMPTRNRASLLKSSLETAVNQSFRDFEIIVCDNNSTDETRQVAEDFMKASDKIKYVNPGRDLSMCDNWDFVLNHATGDFVTYLSDDDGLLLDALSYVNDLISRFQIEVLVWPSALYKHPDVPDSKIQSTLYCDITSGKLFEVESESVIKGLCDFQSLHRMIPKMLNCVVRRELIEKACAKTGRFFVPPFPDYTATCQLLSIMDSYHYIDLPLYIAGASVLSNTGLRYGRKPKAEAFIALYQEDLLEGVQYPMRYLTPSYLLATYLRFKKLYPEKFRHPINMDAYFKWVFKDLTVFEDYDDVSEEYRQAASYMKDYYGSDEVFQKMWHNHTEAKKENQNGKSQNSLRLLGRKLKGTVREYGALYRTAKGIKNIVAPSRPTYLEFSNVQSIFRASQLLTGALPTMAKKLTDLELTRMELPLLPRPA